VTVGELTSKIAGFEDRKRQKIEFLREELAQREVEECNFAPQILTRRKGQP
jgi:hypothetical protein